MEISSNPVKTQALELYTNAFYQALGVSGISWTMCRDLLRETIDWRFACVALRQDEVVGVAGYHSQEGSFTGGCGLYKLYRVLGARALFLLWRSSVAAYYRKPAQGELLHNGLFVTPEHRRQGVACLLVQGVARKAQALNLSRLRLDVDARNSRALSLYHYLGYQLTTETSFRGCKILTLHKTVQNTAMEPVGICCPGIHLLADVEEPQPICKIV